MDPAALWLQPQLFVSGEREREREREREGESAARERVLPV
jgi:hypothetical protein